MEWIAGIMSGLLRSSSLAYLVKRTFTRALPRSSIPFTLSRILHSTSVKMGKEDIVTAYKVRQHSHVLIRNPGLGVLSAMLLAPAQTFLPEGSQRADDSGL